MPGATKAVEGINKQIFDVIISDYPEQGNGEDERCFFFRNTRNGRT
ncbi:MAG: hypothetical protein LUQ50_07355 [Methanospirillum sp.]|nr:hypothetical protein [Methanospirillum sp.]MDD1728870.1 hypothetical protein [Methanospirillum sp.]